MVQWLMMWLCWIQLASFSIMNCNNEMLARCREYNLVDFNVDDMQACCGGECSVNFLKRFINSEYGDMPSCCLTALPPIAILSRSPENYGDNLTNTNLDFSLGTYEFGRDNCATHHICGDRNLFTTLNDLPNDVHVNGISGSSMAKSIGSIRFHIMDTKGHDHLIVLDNVIYLPSAAKNLISVSQWAKD